MLSADCPECGEFGPSIDIDEGEHTCENCGCEYEWTVELFTNVTKEGRKDA